MKLCLHLMAILSIDCQDLLQLLGWIRYLHAVDCNKFVDSFYESSNSGSVLPDLLS